MKSQKRRAKAMFCTECGSELDEFWQSPAINDFKEVLKHRIECLENGRPHNRMCSKLFMATPPDETPRSTTAPRTSKKKLLDLKNSVMEEIRKVEGDGNKEGRKEGKIERRKKRMTK